MAAEQTLTFTDAAFDQDVLNSETPVLVDFWAPWCGPCRAMSPTVDAVATEFAGRIKVGKMNTDDNPGTAMRFQIRGIPTVLLFKGGQVVEQRVGAMPKPELIKMLTPHLPAQASSAQVPANSPAPAAEPQVGTTVGAPVETPVSTVSK